MYSATKFFVRGLTEALNIEYRAHGIQVSAIYVAYVQTGMVFDAKVKPASIERLGVKVTPQQVAAAVWKAVNGDRVHWRVGLDARLINFAVRLLGGGIAPIYRRLMMSVFFFFSYSEHRGQRARHGHRRRRCVEATRRERAAPDAARVEREHAVLVEVAERRPVAEDDARARPCAGGTRNQGIAPAASRRRALELEKQASRRRRRSAGA